MEEVQTPIKVFQLVHTVDTLFWMKLLSKLRQRIDGLISEVYYQVKETINQLKMVQIRDQNDLMEQLIGGNLYIQRKIKGKQTYIRNVKLKNKRKVRSNGGNDKAKKKMLEYQNQLPQRLIEQLDDLFPESGIEAKLRSFNLYDIQLPDDKQFQGEIAAIEYIGNIIFNDHEMVLHEDRVVTFEKFPGSTLAAKKEWKKLRRQLVNESKQNLKPNDTWEKMHRLIDHQHHAHVNDIESSSKISDSEAQQSDDTEPNLTDKMGQADFWLYWINKHGFKCTSLRFVILYLVTLPSHTASVERAFNPIKEMRKGKRNKMKINRARKLIMIMMFLEKETVDWDAVYEIYKDLKLKQ